MRAFLLIALFGFLFGLSGAQTETKPTKPAPPPPAESKPAPKPRETTLEFAQEGERWWWAEDGKGNPLNPPQKTGDASVNVKLPESAETLWVYDAKSGNLAQLKVAELKEKTELKSDSWTHVARLQVNVKAQDKPVASALVSLTDATGGTRTQVLEPSAEGILVFERVPLGKVEVAARYGDEQKASQETTLKAERELRVPIIELALSGTVATLEPTKGAGETEAKAEETPQVSRIGAIVMFVIALALAVGVIYFLIRLATQKPQQLGEAMSKLGVELPQVATSGAGGSAGSAAPSAPPQPDLPPLETAGVPPTATVAPPTVVATGPATRIVATQGPHAGQAFEINADLLTIGREAIHPIALVNDMGVSRNHAQITRQGDQTLIEDLGSTNGTYVNGVRISAPTPIKPGDTLQLGASLFRVE
ncbi:MAG: FHA domain-containing protein [Fimbriimonadales bacterium]|nr:FHA domain-containing protein [Fimbriimonadales bacterium]